jgi:iron(III) transport system substrate-binding protein
VGGSAGRGSRRGQADHVLGDAKLYAEQQSGADGADVVANVNYPWVLKASSDGRLLDFVGPDSTGPQWSGTDFLVDDRVQYSTFTNIGLGWNKDAFADGGPTSFEDLLDPKYAGGQIGLPDPIAPVVADFYASLEANYGPDFLKQLAAQDPVFFPGAVPLEQALAAGEITVGGYVTNIGMVAAKAQGAPVEFAAPANAWAPPIMSYIPAWSKRPGAAQVLIDFMASAAGQAVLGQGSYSPLDGIEGTSGPISGVSVADVDRIVEPGWYDEYYVAWKETFGR